MSIRILTNIPFGRGDYIDSAVEIFYEAFERKIAALMKPKKSAIKVHRSAFKPEMAFYAESKGSIVGLAGLNYRNKSFLEFNYSDLRKAFNPFKCIFYFFIFKFSKPKIKKDVVRLEALAVDKTCRSKGVGTLLIKKVFNFARDNGFKEVLLEVVDTNPRAKVLYERLGFIQKKKVKFYFFTRKAGFSSEYVMSRSV